MSVFRLLLWAVLLGAPALQAQGPAPAKPRRFNVVSRVLGQPYYVIYRPNRTDCGVTATSVGHVPNDVYFDCVWPTGASNNYLFGGGLRVAGLIGPEVAAWAGDTTGAFFFDTKGTTEHGTTLQGMWLSSLPSDHDRWPDIARVPSGAAGAIYRSELQGQVAASDADVWSMIWDGNVNQLAGRAHPLGIAVETRLLGFNHPRGNEDIIYLNFTLYNISATNPGAYAGVRPEIRSTLLSLAQQYHNDVITRFGVTLPADGYQIERYFTDIVTDADVGNAGSNYASVNLPLSLSYTYDHAFSAQYFNRFDPTDHGPPFFAGAGFFGVKVLGAPSGDNQVRLYTSYAGGSFGADASNVIQLYRHLDGTLNPDLVQCNTGDPLVTHICLTPLGPLDVRSSMSSDGGTLAPGQSADYSVAYIFAAPYGSCPAPCDVKPGNPLFIGDPVQLATGANKVDSLTGFTGYSDLNGDGQVQGGELRAGPRSLLAKAQMAQVIFESGFLRPSAPVAPDFYLVPGDDRVTVLWRPSLTESAGDPYYALANSPTRISPSGNTEINPLYDPNYRQFDVEGYRIYRGRTSDPAALTLVAQFDYAGTTIKDYTGRVNPTSTCAPELGLRAGCPVNFDSLVPGQPLTVSAETPLLGQIIQIRDGDRIVLPGGGVAVLHADTVGSWGPDCWCDSGVPFSFVDSTARNGFNYFYTVVAFDVNSLQSAPSSMESDRRLKGVRPARPGSNVVSTLASSIVLEGRGQVLDPALAAPTYDLATGRFSGPFPPANFWSATLLNLVREVTAGSHETRIRLDSLALGQVGLGSGYLNSREPIPTVFHLTVTADGSATHLSLPVQQTLDQFTYLQGPGTLLPVMQTDSALAARYGGRSESVLLDLRLELPIAGWSGEWGTLAVTTGSSERNGARWFDGPSPDRNETTDNPTVGNCFNCGSVSSFNNAGSLTGVATVYQPLSYAMFNREWRNFGLSQSSARRAADYNLYWGTNGVIDSVIDVTHNVPVPFSVEAGGTWGVLNTSAQGIGGHDGRPDVLTPTDWSCVEPFRSRLTQPTNVWFPCTSAAPFQLSQQAALGAIAFGAGDNQSTTNPQSVQNPANLSPQPGFALYLAGTISQFGLNSLPVKGTVWSLRDYVGFANTNTGFVYGGRPWTAVGTELVVRVNARNFAAQTENGDLRRVHPVPDPFYLSSQLPEGEGVRFVNLPDRAIIRIYSSSGVLIRVLEHSSATLAGDTFWDLRSRNGQRVASGVYFYHVEAGDARRAGRMTIINYNN